MRKGLLVCMCALCGVWGLRAASWSLDLRPIPTKSAGVKLSAVAPDTTGALRQHRLAAGAAKASGLAVGDRLSLALFDDRVLEIELVAERAAFAGKSFLGRTQGVDDGCDCVVQETASGLTVDVTDGANRRVWQVVSGEREVYVRELEPKAVQCPSSPLYPPAAKPVTPLAPPATTLGATPAATPAVAANSVRLQSATAAASDETTVDILVAYDTLAATWAKNNGGGLETFAETSVQKMNLALANTGLAKQFSFRLVYVHEIGASAGGDLDYAVNCASGEYYSSTDREAWARIPKLRTEYNADIVCVLTDTGSSAGTTGLGYMLKSDTSDPSRCGCNACAIRSVAVSHTMTHEVGHNMGAGHTDKMSDAESRGPQYHNYSRGYYFTAGGNSYHTIMAYNDDGYGNLYDSAPYFSSPDYRYKGVPVGDALHDNSQTIAQLWRTIAANRQGPKVSSEVGVGLDAEVYRWTTDGNYPWTLDTAMSSDGTDSAVSSQTTSYPVVSWTETQVVGPATLTFSLLMRSYGGRFAVTCDGQELYSHGDASIALYEHQWTDSPALTIPAGEHVVRFSHTNASCSYYPPGNGVWIDRVVFAGGTPVVPVPSGCYRIAFAADGGTGTMEDVFFRADAVAALPKNAFSRMGKSFAGWRCSNGRRYDDGVLVFGLAQSGETVTMTAVWK